MSRESSYVVLLMLAGMTMAGNLPPEFKRCARTDPNFSECLKAAVQDALPKLKNGLPKFGLGPLDPLVVSELRISQGGAGPISADLIFSNLVTTGLLDTMLHKVQMNLDTLTIDASFRFHRAVATSNYTVNGRVLVLPITGAGGSKVVLHDAECVWNIAGKRITKKDKKEYMEVTNVKLKMTPKLMEMQFDNLFNGDQQFGKATNQVLNNNWQLVYNEIGNSFEESYAEVIRIYAKTVFINVPLDELFPENL